MKKRIVLFITGAFLILLASFSPLPPGEWPPPGAQNSEGNEDRYPPSEIDGMEMVYIPAGEFQMGAEQNDTLAEEDEKPSFSVYLDAFWIDRTEVSNQMYAAFLNRMKEGISIGHFGAFDYGNGEVLYNGEKSAIYLEDNLWKVKERLEDYPAVYISWYGAAAYCRWAGRGLPNEAEWEKSGRRGQPDTLPPVLRCCLNFSC